MYFGTSFSLQNVQNNLNYYALATSVGLWIRAAVSLANKFIEE